MKHVSYRPFLAVLSLAVSSLVMASCGGDDDSPAPQGGVSVSVGMSKTPAPVPGSTGTLAFTTGYVVISEVEFKGKQANGAAVSFEQKQVTTLDLATGLASPNLLLPIPAGTYKEVKLEVEIKDEDNRPSIVTEGTYTNAAGAATPVRFEFNSGESFEAESKREVTLAANTPVTSKILFEPRVWFAPITATQLDNAQRVNGRILINESTNRTLFNIVADRLDDLTETTF